MENSSEFSMKPSTSGPLDASCSIPSMLNDLVPSMIDVSVPLSLWMEAFAVEPVLTIIPRATIWDRTLIEQWYSYLHSESSHIQTNLNVLLDDR